MSREEQKQFIKELTGSVAEVAYKLIDQGKIPEGWNGRQLRRWLEYKFKQANWCAWSRKQTNDYNNDVLINDL